MLAGVLSLALLCCSVATCNVLSAILALCGISYTLDVVISRIHHFGLVWFSFSVVVQIFW